MRVGEKEEGATGVQFFLSQRLGRRRTGGGVSAQKGDDAGAVGNTKRVRGVGSFTGGEAAFYREEVRRGTGVPSMVSIKGALMS
jgi:hypothetical protein